ncbi:MAG TPA: CHC2 zinc finger domain-containing protein [Ktedonobacteraceae bacterium]
MPSGTTIHAWCASQNPFEVIGRYVHLDRRGLGCCPFGEHHSDSKDSHPSFKVYQPKRVGGSCWYCYVWEHGGNLFDFLCYWHDESAKTLWHRILTGEVFCGGVRGAFSPFPSRDVLWGSFELEVTQ